MRSFLDGLHTDNKQRIADLLAPDATYWIMPVPRFPVCSTKTAAYNLSTGCFDAQSGHLNLDVLDVTAQEDKVAAFVRGHMPLRKAAGTEFGGVAVGSEGMVVRPGRLLVSLSAGRRITRWNRGSAGPPADSGGYGLVMVCGGLMA
jgi:SnoaL-like domain